MIKGFSTGAIAKGNFFAAIEWLQSSTANAIELSALREEEVKHLVDSIDVLELEKFDYISFHAPSKLSCLTEEELIDILMPVVRKGWPIIIHPDIITNYDNWLKLENCVCIENMDKRKKTGRTAIDLDEIFYRLPNASFCFDIAHARQVDPTMMEAYYMISQFKSRLKEIHISSVNTQSKHEPLTLDSLISFMKLCDFIPADTPLIVESPISPDKIETEMDLASLILGKGFNNHFNKKTASALNLSNVPDSNLFI